MAARSRSEIETDARRLQVNIAKPEFGYRHTCNDRDWCNTTGPTGCSATDKKLAELRAEWRNAAR